MKCPECAGVMKYDKYIHKHVCTRCGLALTTEERERIIRKQREELIGEKDKEEEKRRRRKEYLNWWLSEKES